MASGDWDILVWRRADDLRRQAERIQRNFLQMAVAARYRVQQGRNSSLGAAGQRRRDAKQSLGHVRAPWGHGRECES
jgi:hypothetical protein